jgi:8-oxo-(d)GTP phosphatase
VSEPEIVRAAGGVVVRPRPDGGPEVLLVHRPSHDDWTLPKGKADRDESDEDCALREVAEETGLTCLLGIELPGATYRDRKGRPKVVRYWAMTPTGGRFRASAEVDEVRWLPLAEAEREATYEGDRVVLHGLRTSTKSLAFLVRHGRAGKRDQWEGDDRRRPLDDRGRRQAESLADRLGGYPVTRLVSSPYDRCVQTLEPLARRLELSIELRDELAEGAPGPPALALIKTLAGATPVLSTHGDIVELLCGEDAAKKKGSTWVLEIEGKDVRPVRYLPPSPGAAEGRS